MIVNSYKFNYGLGIFSLQTKGNLLPLCFKMLRNSKRLPVSLSHYVRSSKFLFEAKGLKMSFLWSSFWLLLKGNFLKLVSLFLTITVICFISELFLFRPSLLLLLLPFAFYSQFTFSFVLSLFFFFSFGN